MSQDIYTFPCPSCAVKLSVPKTLAGVRGPCPQCQAEITAPQPEEEPPIPVTPPSIEDLLEEPIRPTPPPLAKESWPPAPASQLNHPSHSTFPPSLEEVTDDIWHQRSPHSTSFDQQHTEDTSSEQTDEYLRTNPPPPKRRSLSKVALALGVLALISIAALAALNFFPKNTLKRLISGQTESPAPPTVPQPPAPISQSAPKPSPINEEPSLEPTPPPPIAPSESATVADNTHTAPSLVESTIKPAEEPATEIAKAEPVTPATETAATEPSANPPPSNAGVPPSLLPDISTSAPQTGDPLQAPRDAISNFLKAKTWRERANFSLDGKSISSEMQKHYRSSKDGTNVATSLEYLSTAPVPGTNYNVHVFRASFSDLPQGCPISVEETADGWKVDWQAFVEFREGRMKKFFEKYQSAPETFRVILRRTHFFDKDIPNLDNKYCFQVTAPVFGHVVYFFVDKNDSIVGPKIANKLDWQATHYDIVKLKWVKGNNNHSYVELRDIVDGWRPSATTSNRASN